MSHVSRWEFGRGNIFRNSKSFLSNIIDVVKLLSPTTTRLNLKRLVKISHLITEKFISFCEVFLPWSLSGICMWENHNHAFPIPPLRKEVPHLTTCLFLKYPASAVICRGCLFSIYIERLHSPRSTLKQLRLRK